MSVPSSSPQLPRVVREYIAAEKENARRWLRAEMDRLVVPLVDSVFDRLTNKLKLIDMDWDRILPGVASDRARVGQVKREIKEEYEMTMQNVMDNAPEGIVDCVKREIKKEEEDGQMVVIKKEEEEDGQMVVIKKEVKEEEEGGDEDEMNANMNNSSDIDSFFARWMRDEVELGEPTRANLELMPISNEPSNQNLTNLVDEESRVNHNTQHQFDEANNNGGMMMQIQEEEEEEVGDVQARVTVMALAANEGANEESSSMEDAQIGTALPHLTGQTLGMVQQSSQTHSKRNGQSVNNQQEDEDDQVVEASRPAKRSRMDTTRPSKATEPTTNPIDANLAQPNGHLQCPHCQKSFIYQSKLQEHLRVHTSERPFHCDQCGKRFKTRDNLTAHQLIHQDIKPFRCTQCEKQFTRKGDLDSHLLVHSGERPFSCRHCEKSFTQVIHRTKHEQAIHLHVKPFRCKQCGHTATKPSHLIQHIRVVHFGLPRSIKEQEALNIVDERDPRELMEKV